MSNYITLFGLLGSLFHDELAAGMAYWVLKEIRWWHSLFSWEIETQCWIGFRILRASDKLNGLLVSKYSQFWRIDLISEFEYHFPKFLGRKGIQIRKCLRVFTYKGVNSRTKTWRWDLYERRGAFVRRRISGSTSIPFHLNISRKELTPLQIKIPSKLSVFA